MIDWNPNLTDVERVQLNGWIIKDVEQTPEVCLAAVQQNGLMLEYVKEQSPKICLEAIRNNPVSIRFVKRQTKKRCIEAVKKNGLVLRYIRNQTEEICLEAIKQNWRALEYSRIKNKIVFSEALKQNPTLIKFIEPDYYLCMIAVKKDGLVLQYIKEEDQLLSICWEAVKQNGLALEFVKDKTPDLCELALEQNPEAKKFLNIFDFDTYNEDYELD